MEAYVDDMIVKSLQQDDHINDLTESFDALHRHQMKLNPTKCISGVTSRKFLDFLVTRRGKEANPKKIKALTDMKHPTSKKDAQCLSSQIASLSQFVSKLAQRCLLFFKTLCQPSNFEWTKECRQAFEELKSYMQSPPLLSKPLEGKILYMHLSALDEAISSVLVQVEAGGQQKSVYYTSKILHEAEIRYPKV